MNRKKFIASIGSGNTIKVYNAETNQLHRVISPGGQLDGQPICSDTSLFVNVRKAGSRVMNEYSLPNGSLKKSTRV